MFVYALHILFRTYSLPLPIIKLKTGIRQVDTSGSDPSRLSHQTPYSVGALRTLHAFRDDSHRDRLCLYMHLWNLPRYATQSACSVGARIWERDDVFPKT